METPDDFRTPANQLRVRHITKEIDRLVFVEGELSAFELHMNITILSATIGEALRRLRDQGQDAEAAFAQAVALIEHGHRK